MYHINLKHLKRLVKENNFEVKQNIKVINSQIILIKMLASGITLQEAAYNLNTTHNNIKRRTQNLLFLIDRGIRYRIAIGQKFLI